MTIKVRIIEREEFYCDVCGASTGAMLSCPTCQAKIDCGAGRHRLMLSSVYLGEKTDRECIWCKQMLHVVMVEAE